MIKLLSSAFLIASQLIAIAPNVLSQPYTLTGSIQVWRLISTTESILREGGSCFTEKSFSDIREGQTVSVRDANDTIVAIGYIGVGQARKDSLWNCAFNFTVPNIPESPFYTVTIATRKPIVVSLDELRKDNWILKLTVGLN